jgi:FMN phosphatase YigB (HAD superfamily)
MTNIKPILFCDFDGVLCHDRYWRSLPSEEYNKIQELLFRGDTALFNGWMRGKYLAEEINQIISEKINMPFEELWEIFVEDCKTARVPKKALEKLHNLRGQYSVILITGNMDSFSRFTHPSLGLDKYFDHISNSHYEGMHKTDNQGELFLKYADKYGVPIEDCILLDDSTKVYEVFTKLGGRAYLVTPEQDIFYHLENLTVGN